MDRPDDDRRRARPAGFARVLLVAVVVACSRGEADWVEAAGDDDPFVRALAVAALGLQPWASPDEVLPVLVEALRDPDPEVGQQAADALLARAEQALPLVLDRLDHPDESLRDALAALVTTLGEDAIPALAAELDSPSPGSGGVVVALLAQLGDAALPALLDATHHGDPRVRRAATDVLAPRAAADTEVLQRLLDLVGDEEPAVRGRAARTVVRVFLGWLDDDEETRAEGLRLLEGLGPVALREVSVLVDDGPAALRSLAAAWLRAQGPEALPVMLAAVHAGTTDVDMVRLLAIAARVRVFGAAALPVLVDELGQDDPARLTAAAAACAALGPAARDAVPALVALLDHASEDVRIAAATALAHVGPLDGPTEVALVGAAVGAGERLQRAIVMAITAGTLATALEQGDMELAALRIVGFAGNGEDALRDLSRLALDEGLRARAAAALEAVRALPEDASLDADPAERDG